MRSRRTCIRRSSPACCTSTRRSRIATVKTYDELAAELARLAPDAIVVVGTPPALAAKRQTTTVPIILAPAADPLRRSLVASLSRPGGNVTGVSLYGSEIARKRMEIFKEAVVGIQRIAVLANDENPLHRFLWDDVQSIGPALGLQFRLFVVSDLDKLPAVFSATHQDAIDAITLLTGAQFFSARRQISSLAAMHRLPAMYESRDSVADGGLISYGANISDLTRRAAAFVIKVINGAKPADLPIEQPTKFELIINLKTAKMLGLEIPPMLLARADEVRRGRLRRGRSSPAPSRTRRKIRYHSSTIRDHIEVPTRGPEHVITNSKNRFH
jgi:putative tryptophan/tyrosine transport system substrate-binding protein